MNGDNKNLAFAYILQVLGGPLALHRHYLGKHSSAILQMQLFFTGIGAIWWFVDLFLLPDMVREENLRLYGRDSSVNVYIDDGYRNRQHTTSRNTTQRVRLDNIKKKKSTEKQILDIAKKHGGKITVTQVAMDTDLSIEQAEKKLQDLVKSGYVQMNVTDNGVMIYEFMELM